MHQSEWVAACALCGLALGCSSSSHAGQTSQQDASIEDGGAVETASHASDGSAALVGDAHSALDGSTADSGDATAHALTCPPVVVPHWDGGKPDGSVCGDWSADTDYDSWPDCIDGCPYDPHKIEPGTCGCNIADTDSDGDGVADCIDRCALDPNNQAENQCGCLNNVLLQAAETRCTDTACGQSDASCNGSGICGDRSVCSPCAGGRYVESEDDDIGYWLCGGKMPQAEGPGCVWEDGGEGAGATRSAAEAACEAKGMTLATIYSLTDNGDLAQLITTRVWIGANDLQTPGQWYWPTTTSNSGELFWSGGPDGGQQNSAFNGWAAGAPGSASCASMTPDGLWYDTDCGETLAFVCAYHAPLL